MATERVIPISAVLEQVQRLEAHLAQIDEKMASLARDKASIEVEINVHRAIASLAVEDSTPRAPAVNGHAPSRHESRIELSSHILRYVRSHPGCETTEVADRIEKYARPYGIKTARKVVTDTIFDLSRRGKLERTPGGQLTVKPRAERSKNESRDDALRRPA